jgi:hypothetical protein
MNRSRVAPVVLAVLAISALGVAATTLETTLSTDPDDVINPDWDRLPIGQGEAATIQNEIADGDDDSEAQRNDAGSGAADTEGGSGDAEIDPSGAGDGDESEGGASSGLRSADGAGESTPLNRLLALLSPLLQVLLGLAGAAVVAAVAYRYRAELHALLGRGSTAEPSAEAPPETDSWPGAEPSNVVDRAWLAVVDRVGPERPETTTVAECVALAREEGSDAAATEDIATAFERVHYGASPVAEEERRARAGLRQLDGDDG